MKWSLSSEQQKKKEREKGGANYSGHYENEGAGPYHMKMPYTWGAVDEGFPEGGERMRWWEAQH